MTAIIIDFRANHQHKTARPDCQEPPPRRRTQRTPPRPAERASADQQIAHITWLLRELEEVARRGERLPQAVLAEAHASIKRTRKMLQSWPGAVTSSKSDVGVGDSVQPNIDPALLERMYRDLGLHP
jgi:hypothetical protein